MSSSTAVNSQTALTCSFRLRKNFGHAKELRQLKLLTGSGSRSTHTRIVVRPRTNMDSFVGKFPGRVLLGRNPSNSEAVAHSWMGSVLPAVSKHVNVAVVALQKDDVIALPSDTLYGLAGNACSATAVQRIYDIKGRDASNPLAICVADVDDVGRYASTEHLPAGILEDLFPGPVTLVLSRRPDSPLHPSLNPGLSCIGIRIPDTFFIRAVARSFGGALALTSANISGQLSTVSVEEFQPLWRQCAAVFDGGELSRGRAGSTVVDLSRKGSYKILREGSALKETVAVVEDKYSLTVQGSA